MLLQMNTLENTYRTYKTFVKAVLMDPSRAGFHFLKITIEEVIDSIFGGLYSAIKVLETPFAPCENLGSVNKIELVANNLVDEKDSLAIGSPFLFFNLTL